MLHPALKKSSNKKAAMRIAACSTMRRAGRHDLAFAVGRDRTSVPYHPALTHFFRLRNRKPAGAGLGID